MLFQCHLIFYKDRLQTDDIVETIELNVDNYHDGHIYIYISKTIIISYYTSACHKISY